MLDVNLLRRADVNYFSLALYLDGVRWNLEHGVVGDDYPAPGPARDQYLKDVKDFLDLLHYVEKQEAEDPHTLLLESMPLFLWDDQAERVEKFLVRSAMDLLMIDMKGNN